MTNRAKQSGNGESNAVPPSCLRNALVAITDTKLFLGYHYGEWTFGPPTLEAAIACCSMSQDELGHSRLLNGILSKHFGENPDSLLNDRTPEQFAHVSFLDRSLPSWSDLIAANVVVDVGLSLYLASFRNSSFDPLRVILDKMLEEEKYHLRHAEGWLRTIASRDEAARSQLAQSIERAFSSWVEWLGPDGVDEDEELVVLGVKRKSNAEVFRQYAGWLVPLVQGVGLTFPDAADLDRQRQQFTWQGWQPQNRRCVKSVPDGDILRQLRGSKNEVFKLVK